MTDAFYKAEYYRALHAGNEGDAEYYAGMIPAPSDILELGCGAGRIALPLQAAGHRVIGVDSHRGLLDLANDAGLETIEADFTNLQLEKSFDHVILAYNGLFCLLSEEAVVRALGVA